MKCWPSVMEAVNTRTISLLTTDVVKEVYWCQQGKNGRDPKEPQYWSKGFCQEEQRQRGHTAEEGAKYLAGSILVTKIVKLQTEYMGIRKTRIIVHGVPTYISEDHLGTFMAKYSRVEVVSLGKSGPGMATSDFEVMVTMTRKIFEEVPNVLTCGGRSIYVMVCLSRIIWQRCVQPTVSSVALKPASGVEKSSQASSEWSGVARRGKK